jgi:hypothetical protein
MLEGWRIVAEQKDVLKEMLEGRTDIRSPKLR